MDFPILIAYLPRLIASFYAAIFDYFMIKLVEMKVP